MSVMCFFEAEKHMMFKESPTTFVRFSFRFG